MGFPRQEYRSDLPFPPPGDLPNLGIKPRSPALQADSLLAEPPGKPGEDMWPFTSHFPEEKSTLREGNPFAQVHEKVWVWAEANLGLQLTKFHLYPVPPPLQAVTSSSQNQCPWLALWCPRNVNAASREWDDAHKEFPRVPHTKKASTNVNC